jgi:predicted DNA binding CopG/RHH family protein
MEPKTKLTNEEKEIENEIENYTSIEEKKKTQVENILETVRKNKAISLRISNYDLEKLKEKAEEEGIPYQTLITKILHKYITNQYFEKNEIIKTIRTLKERKAI